MITSAFTCTGPYAILIMMGVKRVENRSAMPAPEKGRCAVSCSKSFCKEEFGRFVAWAAENLSEEDFARLPSWGDVKDWPGKVVGCCDYACNGRDARCPGEAWDEGYDYWWELSEVVSFDKPIPCRGNVGMWQMPPALAAQVTAADSLERSVGETVATADDAARVFHSAVLIAGENEGFFVLPLDSERRALAAPILVALGEPTTTTVDPGEVFSAALQVGAKAIVVAHNHPSGNLTASEQDKLLTDELARLGDALGVAVLDHLIIGGGSAATFGRFCASSQSAQTSLEHVRDGAPRAVGADDGVRRVNFEP